MKYSIMDRMWKVCWLEVALGPKVGNLCLINFGPYIKIKDVSTKTMISYGQMRVKLILEMFLASKPTKKACTVYQLFINVHHLSCLFLVYCWSNYFILLRVNTKCLYTVLIIILRQWCQGRENMQPVII